MTIPAFVRRQFLHVILHVTDCCNLRCRTCFVSKGHRFLSLDNARVIAEKLGRIRWLDIGGGEPFLHPELVEVCRIFQPSSLTIPTNGQDTESILRQMREIRNVTRDLTIALSLDGFEPENDFIRGKGSYQRALETFRHLKNEAGITLKVNTVITVTNAASLVHFVRFVRELGPHYHSLLLLRGSPASDEMRLPDLALLRSLTSEILDTLATYTYAHRFNFLLQRLKRNYQRYLWNVTLDTLEKNQCLVPCRAPWVHRVIYPNGETAMCELMPPSGNILHESMDLLEQKLIGEFNEMERAKGPCYCTHNCNLGENIMLHPASVLRVLGGKMT